MKKLISLLKALLLLMALLSMAASCTDPYDDSALVSQIKNHEKRIATLEVLCRQIDVDMDSFSRALSTLEEDDLIVSIEPVVENEQTVGYTLYFSKSGPASVTQDEWNVYLRFNNQNVITIPKDQPLTISFETEDLVAMNPNSSRDIRYRVGSPYSDISVEIMPSADLRAVVKPDSDPHTGVLHVETTDSIDESTRLLVFVSDGHKLEMKAIHFERQAIVVSGSAKWLVTYKGSEVDLNFFSNVDCHLEIPESASGWLTESRTKAMTERSLYVNVARNTGVERESKVWIVTDDGRLSLQLIISQEPDPEALEAELLQERAILEKWYRDCGGDSWKQHGNWCSDKPVNEWEGVLTNYGGHVWWVSLPNNNMEGKFPEEIWGLRHLEYLYIPGNNLEIRIPDDPDKLSSSFTEVTLGNFSNAAGRNHLVGGLPRSISKFENLAYFYAPCMEIYGTIPDEIWSLPNLTYLGLGYNHLEGELSPAIGNARKLQRLDLSCNRMYGPIPEALGELKNLTELLLGNTSSLLGYDGELESNHFTRLPESIGNLDSMYTFWIAGTGLEGPIPEGLYDCERLDNLHLMSIETKANYANRLGEFSPKIGNMSNLISVWAYDAGLTGRFPSGIGKLQKLEALLLNDNDLTGNLPEDLADARKLTTFSVNMNCLSGVVPQRIIEAEQAIGWSLEPQKEGYGLTFDIYSSSDYSRDGNVVMLQKASKGDGIDIVLMGDAFCDTDLADGTYERTMRSVAEQFFAVEPYASFKDYFNVYMVEVVSQNNRYVPGAKRALNTRFNGGTSVSGNDMRCFYYAGKAVGEERMDEVLTIVTLNRQYYAGTCYMYHPDEGQGDYGNGPAIAYFPLGTDADMFRGLVQHEAGGHGFAKLDDEYDYGYFIYDSFIEDRTRMFEWGWWPNIDFTSDPASVKWASFLADSRYSGEGLGVFEGAATYGNGIWRPTENSIMRYNTGIYNAPSREAIYTRINKLANGADWQYDYEQFVAWDAVNRAATKAAGHGVLRHYDPLEKPVVTGKSWREASDAPVVEEEPAPHKRFSANARDKKPVVLTTHARNVSATMQGNIITTTTYAPEEKLPQHSL